MNNINGSKISVSGIVDFHGHMLDVSVSAEYGEEPRNGSLKLVFSVNGWSVKDEKCKTCDGEIIYRVPSVSDHNIADLENPPPSSLGLATLGIVNWLRKEHCFCDCDHEHDLNRFMRT